MNCDMSNMNEKIQKLERIVEGQEQYIATASYWTVQ